MRNLSSNTALIVDLIGSFEKRFKEGLIDIHTDIFLKDFIPEAFGFLIVAWVVFEFHLALVEAVDDGDTGVVSVGVDLKSLTES